MRTLVATLLGAVSLTAGNAAQAQEQEPGPPDAEQAESVSDSEIVVTGLRRESTAQDTAATISVISADTLAKSGVTGSMALQFQTPGVVISQDLGLQTQVYIRGIGSNLQGIAVSNSVATYVDGVYVPNSVQSAQSFNNVERVEILKGPQATLYGRNATGGAINIVTQRPSFSFSGKADLSYGNYNDKRLHVSATGPVIDDVLAAGIAFQYEDHDGYAENLYTGQDILAQTVVGVRGSLLLQASDSLTLIARADYTYNRTSDFLKLYPSTAVYYIGASRWYDARPRKAYYDIQPDEPIRDSGMSLSAEWDTSLGKVTSVTSYRWFKAGPIYSDSDQVATPGTYFPAGIGRIGDIITSKSLYHETYLATPQSKPVSAIFGVTYFKENASEEKRLLTGSLAAPRSFSDRFGRNEAIAGYVDGNWRLSNQLNLVGGLRYTHETRDYDFYRVVPVGAPTLSAASFNNWSPRFGIEYRPADKILLFATATSGFKSGGFNADTPTNSFRPEKIWSYEAGAKTTLFDKLRLNASGFYYDYKDIQVLQYITVSSILTPIITNAGSAKLWGADFTADLQASSNFNIGAGLSLLHSEFGSAVFCDPLFGSCTATDPANRPLVDVEGKRLPRAPAVTANLYGDYTLPLGGDMKLNLHGDAAYRSKTYFTVFQNEYYAAPGFWLFNANARLSFGDMYIEVYGQNLANKLAITQIINSSPLRNSSTGALIAGTPARFERYSPPRTYGVRIGTRF